MRAQTALLLVMLVGCGGEPAVAPPPVTPAPVTTTVAPRIETTTLAAAGVDPSWIDRDVDPCDDLYQFACGGFLAHAEIPPDMPSWRPATQIRKRNEDFLHDTLEHARTAPGDDPVLARLGAFYGACMNEDGIEQAGLGAVQPLLAVVAKVHDRGSLDEAIIALHRAGIFVFFNVAGGQDLKDSQRVIGWIDQSGLGLPEREYYLAKDKKAAELRAAYVDHVAKTLILAGDPPAAAAKDARDVLRLETALAEISIPLVERRDSLKTYHKVDRAGVIATAPKFPWDQYFAALGAPDLQDISVTSTDYLGKLDALIAKEKPAEWRAYLRWQVLKTAAPWLGKGFVAEDFAMRKLMTGQDQLEPRWKTCVRATDGALAELLAQPFIKARYSEAARKMTADLIGRVRDAMRADLAQLPWMDAPTREAALAKLAKMKDVIGYPSHPKAYDFALSPTDYARNRLASQAYEVQRSLRKVGKPLNPEDWDMTPVTVDAFYDATRNSMNFPAGILQPPYFGEHFAAAVNYGGMASTIGHELTHGFDDDGAKYDGDGNLHDWWSAESKKEFKARTACVVKQYSGYEPLPGIKVNGELTQGENIADIGGLKLAFAAYRAERQGAVPLVADGFTEDQLFFIAHAQGWCDKTRPEIVEMMLKTDPHTPRRYRVNGAASDVDAFATAFSCPVGKAMNPKDRCVVW